MRIIIRAINIDHGLHACNRQLRLAQPSVNTMLHKREIYVHRFIIVGRLFLIYLQIRSASSIPFRPQITGTTCNLNDLYSNIGLRQTESRIITVSISASDVLVFANV